MARLYSLLVGINDYPAPINQLSGCLNDIENAGSYLKDEHPDAAVVVLKDAEATRANVIDQFRKHLGQAGRDDIVLFQYCGHGAKSTAALEFNKFDRDLHDEGLVLVDSRLRDDTFDLADKELALLISELATKEPHIAVVLDCCHSGSGTRELAGQPAAIRSTIGKFPSRPIESYLEGQYAAMAKAGGINLPVGRHILLAACDRSQTAKEDGSTRQGLFTTSFYNVLRSSVGGMTYAELFVRARAAVRETVRQNGYTDQDPQFEPAAGFDSYNGVFGAPAASTRKTYLVSHDSGDWRVNRGAINGNPTDPAQSVELVLHPDGDPTAVAGTARTTSVGAQTSAVQLRFDPGQATRFTAEFTSMPEAPMLVAFQGDQAAQQAIDAALKADAATNVQLVAPGADDGFALVVDGAVVTLVQRDSGKRIRAAAIGAGSTQWADPLLAALRHVAQWRRTLTLTNPHPKLDPAKVDFVFVEHVPDGGERHHVGPDIQLEAALEGKASRPVKGELRVRNRTGHPLNYALLHCSSDYEVEAMSDAQIVSSDEYQLIVASSSSVKASNEVFFTLNDGKEAIDHLKLILSTERIDAFLLELKPLSNARDFGNAADAPDAAKPVTDDWFTKELRVRTVPRVEEVGPKPVAIAGGRITVEAHPSVTAGITLSTAIGPARGDSVDSAFVTRLNAAGLTLPGIEEGRGDSPNVIQLTDITNSEALAETPIAISIDVPLGDGELLVPVVNDGGQVMLAGEFWRDEQGKTQVRIDRLPSEPVEQRGLGSALWMYLCKAYFHSDHVNRMRWVEKTPAGVVVHKDGLEEKVAKAQSVLVVIHGIIGASKPMAEAVLNNGIGDSFDLVLSYDYENLSTPIEDTARTLRDDLARAGLRADDGKRLVILAHSMGGLVARWFVEKEGGASVVDHLVLCGTPNAGSPFGKVETARRILTILATLTVNIPALAPLCGSALAALAYSKKLTPTLEEMAPHSPFISTMFSNNAAGVPITILAGDIDKYQDENPRFFERLLVKLGRGPAFDALFDSAANDLAVAVGSICAPTSPPLDKANRVNVACHHLNYFQSEAGLAALQSLDWKSFATDLLREKAAAPLTD